MNSEGESVFTRKAEFKTGLGTGDDATKRRIADAVSLPFSDSSFDWAISVATYHHIRYKEEREEALDELRRVLRPGGEAFITVWNRWQPKFWFSRKEVAVPWRTKGKTLYRYYMPHIGRSAIQDDSELKLYTQQFSSITVEEVMQANPSMSVEDAESLVSSNGSAAAVVHPRSGLRDDGRTVAEVCYNHMYANSDADLDLFGIKERVTSLLKKEWNSHKEAKDPQFKWGERRLKVARLGIDMLSKIFTPDGNSFGSTRATAAWMTKYLAENRNFCMPYKRMTDTLPFESEQMIQILKSLEIDRRQRNIRAGAIGIGFRLA